MSNRLKYHKLAELFPLMSDEDLDDLAADIKAHGLRAPITLLDEKILDGRNRYRACNLAGVTLKTKNYSGDDPLAFVLSANLKRRHLTTSQRAIIAAEIATLSKGGQESNAPKGAFSQSAAAAQMGVTRRSVQRAKKVLKNPKLKAAVKAGQVTVTAAAEQMAAAHDRPKEKTEVVTDSQGYPVPKQAMEIWNRRDEAKKYVDLISEARCAVRNLIAEQETRKTQDLLYIEVNLKSVLAELNNAFTEMNLAVPKIICGVCQGGTPKTCMLCKGRGVISKNKWDLCVPVEIKEMRRKAVKK